MVDFALNTGYEECEVLGSGTKDKNKYFIGFATSSLQYLLDIMFLGVFCLLHECEFSSTNT